MILVGVQRLMFLQFCFPSNLQAVDDLAERLDETLLLDVLAAGGKVFLTSYTLVQFLVGYLYYVVCI